MKHREPAWSAVAFGAALALIAVLAIVIRALGHDFVFVGDEVVFPPADAQYHLRRAYYSFINFPDVLLFDPYINYPGGASVPWPPLFDFVLGGAARLFASDAHGFEVVVAWAPPIFAVLGLVAIYRAGALVESRAVGLLAAFSFALLPASVAYTRLGNADHHAAVGAVGAWLLYTCLLLVDPAAPPARMRVRAWGLLALRLALMLTWHGSLLYLAIAEATLLFAGLLTGRRALLRVQAVTALATAGCLAPILAVSPTPLGGDYSSIALSRLHVMAMLGVACTAGGLAWFMRSRPSASIGLRIAAAAGAGLLFVGLLLLLPGPREGLVPAFRFMTMRDDVGLITGEQSPLLDLFGRAPGRPAWASWGHFAYLIPLAPAAALFVARDRQAAAGRRFAALALCGWGAAFGALTLVQRRYGNDFAPAASLLFAIGLGRLAGWVLSRAPVGRARPWLAGALAIALSIALFWPALRGVYWPRARAALAPGGALAQAEGSPAATLTRFTKEIARTTPETSGWLASGAGPEYGVLAHANLGHAIQYGARRATATDPFWAYIGQQNWDLSFDFLAARSEMRALQLASLLRGRFVVTMVGHEPTSVVARLHAGDGAAVGERPPLRHFRLITEAPAGGRAIGEIFRPGARDQIPYKLFEIVNAARLEVHAPPGESVEAIVEIRTATGRRFTHRASGVVTEDGIARLRLPYASERVHPARAAGPYQVLVGGRPYRVAVSERDVLEGRVVRLDALGP
jgi:dolichyl-diphosphooligosaccharide--protein glycosyltransferase